MSHPRRWSVTTGFVSRLLTVIAAFCLTTSLPAQSASSSASAGPLVRTSTGRFEGSVEADGTLAFKGIRYAIAPVGALR